MGMRWALTVLLALGLSAGVVSAQAPEPSPMRSFLPSTLQVPSAPWVQGRVVDGSSSRPVPGAEVRFVSDSLSTETDRDGSFRISAPAAGVVTLEVTATGYAPTRRSLDLRFSAGAIVVVRMREALPEPEPR